MRVLLRSFKTEINPTEEQKIKICKTIGTCRFLYNFYISHNMELYKRDEKFMSSNKFRLWLNHEYIPEHPDHMWIKEAYSKARTQAINNAETAFKRFFNHKSSFPKFKKKNKSNVKMYFVKNGKRDCECERHRIKIPSLGWVRIKEKGYIPTTRDGYTVRSGSISIEAGRYYVSALVDIPDKVLYSNFTDGIGIDLGIKNFAVISNGKVYSNINKSSKIKKLEKKLRREQRCLSRKYEYKKKFNSTEKNLQKQIIKVQKIYCRIGNIRKDYINKTIAEIVKTKPSFIAIEDLNVSGMMKNKHLSKSISSQKFYEFREKLKVKCKDNGIELRIVDRWYPSSKICHCCGNVKSELKLSDRVYHCSCGYTEDRDINASLNIRDAKTYAVSL